MKTYLVLFTLITLTLSTTGLAYNCISNERGTSGLVQIANSGRFELVSLNYCRGWDGEESTNCTLKTTRYEKRYARLKLWGKEVLQTEIEVTRANDLRGGRSSWIGRTTSQKTYDVSFDFVDRSDFQGYRLWVRVFQGVPFQSPELYRFEMKCDLGN